MNVLTGLERLICEKTLQEKVKGNIGILCHSASVTKDFHFIIDELIDLFGDRVKKLFGPQHGLVTDVQDNMVETKHTQHPYYKRPVYSLYSETRSPTDEMLDDLDVVIVDLQDVGTRVYTYISTLTLLMQKAQKRNLKIIVLDRPNPIRGDIIEGALSQQKWTSFVSQIPDIPMRHGLTLGEVALWVQKELASDVELDVIKMKNWTRQMSFKQTGLPWVPPSPNLPTAEGALVFPGSVLFEGTLISEGRGTTRSLEQIGHPKLEPHSFIKQMNQVLKEAQLTGQYLRPVYFWPMFQKHAQSSCGGVFIHPLREEEFRPWSVGQLLLRELKKTLQSSFQWNDAAYEYETENLAIDYINSGPELRQWVESDGSYEDLQKIEEKGQSGYLNKREDILLYSHHPA